MSKQPADPLAELLQNFFYQRLQSQQAASAHTLASYRDTFRLLLKFIQHKTGRSPSHQQLQDWNAANILQFLDHLEKQRGCRARTRNSRLAAIRTFMRYVAQEEPALVALTQRVLVIPMKRFDRPVLGYLSPVELRAILAATDSATTNGQRDHLLFG